MATPRCFSWLYETSLRRREGSRRWQRLPSSIAKTCIACSPTEATRNSEASTPSCTRSASASPSPSKTDVNPPLRATRVKKSGPFFLCYAGAVLKLSKPCPVPDCGGAMLGVTNTPPLRRTIEPKTGDGILYCDRCGHQEHRYKLHAITLAVELKGPDQWVGQFRITLLGKQATTICTAYASGRFDNQEGAEAAGLAAAKAWIDSQAAPSAPPA